jgi:enoyl-CoA hydratase/carnithine racemase
VIRLSKAPYITIGSVRGRTRGAGNELALGLDLRYASLESAYFGQPEVGIGILPGGGGTERLPRLLGRDRALEAIRTSSDYGAAQTTWSPAGRLGRPGPRRGQGRRQSTTCCALKTP